MNDENKRRAYAELRQAGMSHLIPLLEGMAELGRKQVRFWEDLQHRAEKFEAECAYARNVRNRRLYGIVANQDPIDLFKGVPNGNHRPR